MFEGPGGLILPPLDPGPEKTGDLVEAVPFRPEKLALPPPRRTGPGPPVKWEVPLKLGRAPPKLPPRVPLKPARAPPPNPPPRKPPPPPPWNPPPPPP